MWIFSLLSFHSVTFWGAGHWWYSVPTNAGNVCNFFFFFLTHSPLRNWSIVCSKWPLHMHTTQTCGVDLCLLLVPKDVRQSCPSLNDVWEQQVYLCAILAQTNAIPIPQTHWMFSFLGQSLRALFWVRFESQQYIWQSWVIFLVNESECFRSILKRWNHVPQDANLDHIFWRCMIQLALIKILTVLVIPSSNYKSSIGFTHLFPHVKIGSVTFHLKLFFGLQSLNYKE